MENLTVLLPMACIFLILYWYLSVFWLHRQGDALVSTEEIGAFSIYSITKKDLLPMLAISLGYAIVAFTMLGDTEAPQSLREYEAEDVSVFDFREVTQIDEIMYFSSLHTGGYSLEYSQDGESFEALAEPTQAYNELFKWNSVELEEPVSAQYIRLTANNRLDLAELAFCDSEGNYIVPECSAIDAILFDEQDIIPENGQNYMNSTYFDEVYHARTAFEHLKDVEPYEISHPPLGKLIISQGIDAFGMTPFGWRFMGTLFGVLMIPVLYILLKLMFGCTIAAAAASFIFAFDFMHYVQTRIATIDTYAVFFILLSFMFMFMFVRRRSDDSAWQRLVPLALCGVTWGIGCASKWTVIYAGAGLGIIWLGYWIMRYIALKNEQKQREFYAEFFKNSAFCVIFFIVAPLTIYYMSYYPYGTAAGMSGFSMYFNAEYFDIVIENQQFMFNYHSDLVATHSYSSRWWQWILNLRPILYYLDYVSDTTKSAFGAFGGPILTWGGAVAMAYMFYKTVKKRDFKAFMISIGYLASLVPWIVVDRLTFAYHYFPCMIFLAMAIGYVFAEITQKTDRWRPYIYSACTAAMVCFIMFYPVLSGIEFSRWYTNAFLRWIPSAWPF